MLNMQYCNIYIVGHSWTSGAFKNWNISKCITVNAKIGSNIQWSINQIDKLKKNQYERIYVFTGINDYTDSEQNLKNKFNKLTEIALSKSDNVYLFNIPRYSKCEQKIKNINQYIETIEGITVIDVYSKYKNSSSLHPKSYEGVREIFLETLKK